MENKIATKKNSPPNIKIIVGIGNPEKEFNYTYHNIGKMFLNFLSGEKGWKSKTNFLYKKEKNIIFVKTETFMNLSGETVKEILTYFKISPSNMLLVHDDSDIALGEYKIQFGRGSAGHKGVLSVIEKIKTKNFWRLRIGVREKETKEKAEKFILKKINPNHLETFEKTFKKIKEDLEKNYFSVF